MIYNTGKRQKIGNEVREAGRQAGRGQIMWDSVKVRSLNIILDTGAEPLEGFAQESDLISILKIVFTVK